ncbi:hypothetical protein CJ231_07430 [Hoylesella buccalis]|uniref:Uncharacterized protein n=1 Tax=Hoylesella buccalis TaxID=28127 RepID=A0A2N6QQT3_9BACT|nr:hypothetical protein CJ231_07430 [Hoylesella buccalis]
MFFIQDGASTIEVKLGITFPVAANDNSTKTRTKQHGRNWNNKTTCIATSPHESCNSALSLKKGCSL